jgi:hypothetical protein
MKHLTPVLIASAAALAFTAATTAVASGPSDRHEITVRLPGGGIERIEYTGEAPRIVVSPAPFAQARFAPADFWAPFAGLEQISADMDRQMDALWKDQMAVFANAPKLDDAKLTNLPPGTVSTTWVSTSFGNGFCSRVTQISEPASGGKPQVQSHETGDCGAGTGASSSSQSAPNENGIVQTALKAHKASSKPTSL